MANSTYIHGADDSEQERLALLNRLTNQAFINFLALDHAQAVLEIGSGLGILTSQVATLLPHGKVWGIEYSTEQLSSTLTSLPANLHFVRGDAHRLPFNNEHFDLVYCRYVLEHVADPLRVLREGYRALRPGGRMCVQENNILALILYPPCPHFDTIWRKFAHLQAQLGGDAEIGKKLLPLFTAAGFRHIELSIAPEIHYAGTPTFRPWVENLVGNVRSGTEALQQRQLATQEEITEAIAELRTFMEREDASLFFYWNRAAGKA